MDSAPTEAAGSVPAEQTVETPNTNTEPVAAPQAPDMHGFTSEDLAGMRVFIDNNGGWDKIKSRISNPEKATEKMVDTAQVEQKKEESAFQPQAQPVEIPKTPKGAITQDDLMAQYYFETLSKREEYAPISKEIADGVVLTEMAKLGIPFRNQDGSWNNDKIKDYLDLRAKTVPAKPTTSEPNAGAAPTVTYTEVGDNITSMDQAYKVLLEPGNPAMGLAEKFIKENFNGKK